MIGKIGKTKASVVVLVAALLGVVFATTASNAGNGPPRCFGKQATIVRGDGENNIVGTNGRDVIVTRGGDDIIDAGKGRDRICSGHGNDFAKGSQGVDYIRSGRGRDLVLGGRNLNQRPDGDDHLYGGRGSEWGLVDIQGAQYSAGISGGPGDDLLNGGRGTDKCLGGPGDDRRRKCER